MSFMENVEVLRAACCVATADKEITSEEAAYLQELAGNVGVGKASLDAMIEMASCDANFCAQQFRILTGDSKQSMEVLVRMALADGKVVPQEAELLKSFAKRLGLDSDQCREIVARVRNES